jgi:tetratricopeptide (TPR) repeat protein
MPRSYFYLGQAYLDAGRYGEAIIAMEKGLAFKQGVPDPVFYQVLGDAYAFSEKYAEAERYYTVHLRIRPEDTKTLQNLSLALMMQNKDKDARAVLQRWLKVAPEDPNALKLRSVLDAKDRRKGGQ